MSKDKTKKGEPEGSPEELEALRKRVEELQAELAKAQGDLEKANADRDSWKNQYYMAYADTQNLRKAIEEEKSDAIRFRAAGFLENLLPALDSFHMALEMPAPTKEAQNYQVGFTYIYNSLVSSLTDEGVSEISPKVGDDFDVSSMHAVDAVESADVAPGKVARVAAKGYKLHDRLIRAAMVYVAKAKEEKPAPEAEPQEETKEAAKA